MQVNASSKFLPIYTYVRTNSKAVSIVQSLEMYFCGSPLLCKVLIDYRSEVYNLSVLLKKESGYARLP